MYGYSTYDYRQGRETGSELYRYNLSSYSWEIIKTYGITPGPRNTHFSYVYQDSMFVLYGMKPETLEYSLNIVRYDFLNSTWSLVKVSNVFEFRTMSANVKVGSKVYLLYGAGTNSAVKVDLSLAVPGFEFISVHWETPAARLYHASFVANEYLYIFGGISGLETSNIEYFNDLWEFSFLYQNWTNVNSAGLIPSPRSNFGFVDYGAELLFVFGGRGYEGYLNELFYLHIPSKKWFQFEQRGEWPSPRSHSCLTYCASGLFLVGGKYKNTGFNDIWFYDFSKNTFTFLDTNIIWYGATSYPYSTLVDTKCWLTYSNSSATLNIAGGLDILQQPNFNLIQVFLLSNYTQVQSTSINPLPQSIFGAETSIFQSGSKIIRVSGSIFSWIIIKDIMIFDIDTKLTSYIDTTDYLGIYGHSAVYYKKSIYVFGGGGSIVIYRSDQDNSKDFIKIDLEGVLNCSKGTFGNDCDPCPAGTYEQNGICEKCPEGTYADKKGSSSLNQCKPCPYGYFSRESGAKFCLQCESGYDCLIGSSSPSQRFELPGDESYQPKSLSLPTTETKKYYYKLCYFDI